MSPSRFVKSLLRSAKISWRDQPTRHDIEALEANIERVGLVIRVRWALVAVLVVFSALGGSVFAMDATWSELVDNMRVPAIAVVFVVCYNTYYSLTYRRVGNISFLNHAQLLFDAMVVTVLVYYSGGVYSWFHAMFALFVFEAAFILPKARDTLIIAAFCALAYGAVLWGEYFGLLEHVDIPYTHGDLHLNRTYVTVRYMWQVALLGGASMVAILMTSAVRGRENQLASSAIVDEKTGLYDRRYFLRALASELRRAERDGRQLWALMLDIDDFAEFNRMFGIPRGDEMIGVVADALSRTFEECAETGFFATNLLSRFGGEEFAILLVEGPDGDPPDVHDAETLAEALREAVEVARSNDASVTVSVGAASYPEYGPTADTLLSAVEEALLAAAATGGNRVVVAGAAL